MRHLSGCANHHAQRALGGQCEAVVRGFAIDEKAAAFRRQVGNLRASGIALLTRDEEQSDLRARIAQTLHCADLRGDDALGVAGASAVDVVGVLGACDEGRHRIEVSRKDDVGSLTIATCIEIGAGIGSLLPAGCGTGVDSTSNSRPFRNRLRYAATSPS